MAKNKKVSTLNESSFKEKENKSAARSAVKQGQIERISGPVVEAYVPGARLYDVVKIGNEKLLGEIIKIVGNTSVIQVYEDTSGLKPGEPTETTGQPLSVELGPGILQSIYDGIQRPLKSIEDKAKGVFIPRGIEVSALDRKKVWEFKATVKKGDKIKVGDIIGTVQETELILHKIMSPYEGKIESISTGKYTIEQEVGSVSHEGKKYPLLMYQRWFVRKSRPVIEKFPPTIPLVTGQRIIDTFFPIAKGGTACIPGPFGSGKCVAGDTPILLNDGSIITMEKLYERCKEKGNTEIVAHEETIQLPTPLGVYSLDGSKMIKSSSSIFFKDISDTLIDIRTRSGRRVKVTPVHKLFKINETGEIEETMAKDLKGGEFIVGIRKIETKLDNQPLDIYSLEEARVVDQNLRDEISNLLKSRKEIAFDLSEITIDNLKSKSVTPKIKWITKIYQKCGLSLPQINKIRGNRRGSEIKIPNRMTKEFAEFLGYFISEGYVRAERVIVFTNSDQKLLDRFSYLAKMLFDIEPKVEIQKGKTPNILLNSKVLVDFIGILKVGDNAATKRIPSQLLKSSNETVLGFLGSYFLGDGSYYDGQLEFTTASEELAMQLSYCLTRFGLMHSISERSIEGRIYKRIFVRGKNELASFLAHFVGWENKKFQKIASYIEKTKGTYTATDVVPLNAETLTALYSSADYTLLKKNGIEIHNYIGNKEKMSVKTFKKFVSLAGNRNGNQFQQQKLITLSESLEWIFCDEIVSSEEEIGPFHVYDVSIPGLENFVGGHGGLLLHNTVTQQSLAKYSDTQIVVYIGCGERGNEMTDVLKEFPHLIDPKSGKPLMQRTVLIANTSNMPVAAREASVYTGVTIAEYFRDMGYDVALMADSTSRWAEAMREIGGRLEEMPGEEGYPAYLARRLAEFYERAGRVRCLGTDERYGSVSIIGAVSPPGGDISEPVSQNTLRVTKVFLALDASLAYRRHFPAINWLKSYTLYSDSLEEFYAEKVSSDFTKMIKGAMALLQKEAELQEVVQLVGPDALPEKEQAVLMVTKMLREDYLQQNAYSDVDARCELRKQYQMLKTIMRFGERTNSSLDLGVQLKRINELKVKGTIGRMKEVSDMAEFDKLQKEIDGSFDDLLKR